MNHHRLKELSELIEKEISSLPLPAEPEGLYEPLAYCLGLSAKRMRPLMTLLGCELFGGNARLALPAALGLELFHNFTLMHDDIMDNADIRRGQPSVHKKWDINTAILSGDVLFALAGKYILQVPDHCLRKIAELYHQTVIEVCEGQQLDMNFETCTQVSQADYMEMIRLKTAVLPAACLKTGALIAGAPDDQAALLYRFGEAIGLAFQLRDDFLDAFGESEVFGKKTGGDIRENKKTWLYIKALEAAPAALRQELLELYASQPSDPSEKIERVKSVFTELGVDELARQEMQGLYQQAFTLMDGIQVAQDKKEPLTALARGLFDRKN